MSAEQGYFWECPLCYGQLQPGKKYPAVYFCDGPEKKPHQRYQVSAKFKDNPVLPQPPLLEYLRKQFE